MHEPFFMHDDLSMLPEAQARRHLGGLPLTLAILRPPYPALGVGALRVLRVRENAQAGLELIAGYDNYQRLGDRRTYPTIDPGQVGAVDPSSAPDTDPLGP